MINLLGRNTRIAGIIPPFYVEFDGFTVYWNTRIAGIIIKMHLWLSKNGYYLNTRIAGILIFESYNLIAHLLFEYPYCGYSYYEGSII